MGYVIKNNKNLFVRLNENGKAITCGEKDMMIFEQSKAKNILSSLPKGLKRLGFNIICVPDPIVEDIKSKSDNVKEKVISGGYEPCEEITRWINKFGSCDDILTEAETRREELRLAMSNKDKELTDLLHKIELESNKGMYDAWLLYRSIKENRKERRNIKNELIIISSVLSNGYKSLNRDVVKKSIDGLSKRKYSMRIVEEGDNENDLSKL